VKRQHILSPEREADGGSGEGFGFEEGAICGVAAHAITVRALLPRAAPGDVGAVHHDTSLDAASI
jgi:hypothetical protein